MAESFRIWAPKKDNRIGYTWRGGPEMKANADKEAENPLKNRTGYINAHKPTQIVGLQTTRLEPPWIMKKNIV